MAATQLLAAGNGVSTSESSPAGAQVDVTHYRTVRITVANSAFSPAPVAVTIAHIMEPGTPQANAIDTIDQYTLDPDQNISRSYDVPGQTIALEVSPASQSTECTVFFTVYARTD